MSFNSQHVVFAGGGTGGHLFPGLAVAEALRARMPSVAITFCGSGKAFERAWVEGAGFDYVSLTAQPIPRSLSALGRFLRDQPRAILGARKLLRSQRISAVVGLGGYASVPVVRAAQRQGVPVVLLEQNLIPGRATRWLARSGTTVCATFEETEPLLSKAVTFHCTGNPVRVEIAELAGRRRVPVPAGLRHWTGKPVAIAAKVATLESASPYAERLPSQGIQPEAAALQPRTVQQKRTLLVLGGSQGARSLNRALPAALARLETAAVRWHVIHQTGRADWRDVVERYRATAFSFEVAAFLDDMPRAYRESDLVVCRAGGTTLAEVACAGLPAVLVPYPHAAADHQRHNADWYARREAACLVEDQAAPAQLAKNLTNTLSELFSSDDRLARMAGRMGRLGRPDATEAVVDLVVEGLGIRGRGSGVGGRGSGVGGRGSGVG